MDTVPNKLLKAIIPKPLRSKLFYYYKEKLRRDRKEKENAIPKVFLTDEHIKNCQLILDRSKLLLKLMKGGNVAEIGVKEGRFSEKILKNAVPNSLHLIDTWTGPNEKFYETVKSKFAEEINEGTITLHRNLSTEAVDHFEDNYFDWIYIDTDHSYEVTWDELVKYAPKVKKDGVIAGHDYSMGHWIKSFRYGVIEAVHKFCVEHEWEIVYLTAEPLENQSFAIRRIH